MNRLWVNPVSSKEAETHDEVKNHEQGVDRYFVKS